MKYSFPYMNFNLYNICWIWHFLANYSLKNVLCNLFWFFKGKKITLMIQKGQKQKNSSIKFETGNHMSLSYTCQL